MGCRAFLFLIIVGCVMFYWGFSERHLAEGASAAPVPITLTELEKGAPDNPYRTLGEHIPVTNLVVYQEDEKTKHVDHAYYPAVTEAEVKDTVLTLAKKHGGDVKLVTDQELTEALPVKVLIKTKRWSDANAIQQSINGDNFPKSNIAGMVTNRIDTIPSDQAKLLTDSYKGLNTGTVIIFEEGRTPESPTLYWLAMAGGAVILLGTVVGMVIGRKK